MIAHQISFDPTLFLHEPDPLRILCWSKSKIEMGRLRALIKASFLRADISELAQSKISWPFPSAAFDILILEAADESVEYAALQWSAITSGLPVLMIVDGSSTHLLHGNSNSRIGQISKSKLSPENLARAILSINRSAAPRMADEDQIKTPRHSGLSLCLH